MLVHLAAAAESVWLRSWNHIYCSMLLHPTKCANYAAKTISAYYEMHSAVPNLEFNTGLTFGCKSYITGHEVFLHLEYNMFGQEQVRKSVFFMLNLPSCPDFSLSLQISQCANKPIRSVSEQTELRGEKRIRETWSSWVGVCLETHSFFFPPHVQLGLN